MKRLYFLLLVIIYSYSFAQTSNPQWINYCTHSQITCMTADGNTMWIGTSNNGLFQADLNGNIIRSFTENTGLASNNVTCIAVDKKGYKWIGSDYGISKFDEYKWQIFTTSDGLIANKIYCITIDSLNKKWIGTSSGIIVYNDITWTTFSKSIARSISIDSGGNKWIASNESVLYLTDSSEKKYGFLDGLPGAGIKKITIDKKGVVWGIGFMGAYVKFQNNNWTFLRGEIADGGFDNSDLVADLNDNIWIALNDSYYGGMQKINGTSDTYYHTKNGLTSNNVTTCAIDSKGNLWYGTSDNGAGKFDGNTWYSFPFITGIAGPEIYTRSISIDKQNTKWIGTVNNGIFRFDGNSWSSYSTSNGLTSNHINVVAVDEQNILWLGSNNGVQTFDGKTWKTYTTANGLINNNVYNITFDNQGNTFLGTSIDPSNQASGISKYDGKRWTSIIPSNTILGNIINALLVDKKGNLWIGTYEGVVEYQNGIKRVFNKTNGLLNNEVHYIYEDSKGYIWVATYGGTSMFDGTKWSVINNSSDITSIIEDKLHNIWLSNRNFGVYKYNGTTWQTFNTSSSSTAIGSNFIYSSSIDNQGNLWFGSDIGLSEYNENGVDNSVTDSFTHLSGRVFLDNDSNSVFTTGDFYLKNQKIILLPDSLITFTNSMGEYNFQVDLGSQYIIQVIPQKPYYKGLENQTSTVLALLKNNKINDIGVFGKDSINVTSTITSGINRCGFTMPLTYSFTNNSLHSIDALVSIYVDKKVIVNKTIPSADSVGNNGRLFWKYSRMPISQDKKIMLYIDSIKNSLDTLLFDALIFSPNKIVSSKSIAIPTRCSFDPNDKQVTPIGVNKEKLILKNQDLQYTVRFQNTGNDYAYDVKIIDTLNAQLDWSTLAVSASSHQVRTELTAKGIVTFYFENIMLPDSGSNYVGSNGFVSYTIKPKASVTENTKILNTAHIIFDQNPAVVTNTTLNTLVSQLPCSATSKTISVFSKSDYIHNGQIYTKSGTYTQKLLCKNGCDSLLTIKLMIDRTDSSSISISACQKYLFNTIEYNKSGNYVQKFKNKLGFDSLVTLHLIVNNPTDSIISKKVCTSYTLNKETYKFTGKYYQYVTNKVGCESTITLNLEINKPSTNSISTVAFKSYTLNSQTYTTSNDYFQTVTNAAGCDSTISLHLLITNIAGDINGSNTIDGTEIAGDTNGNGKIDANEITGDINGDGIINNNEVLGDTNGNGILDTGEVTGILEINGCSVSLYPVPVKDKFTIRLTEGCEPTTISISNSLGQTIYSVQKPNGQSIIVDMTNQASGSYVIQVVIDGKSYSTLVVKN